MEDEKISVGKDVLLLNRRQPRKRWLLKIKTEDEKFHTDKGLVDFKEIIGKKYGDIIKTNKDDTEFILCKPTLFDFIMKSRRKSQIIYPKDAAIIILFSNIQPGSKVIESGIGSGGLTMALANAVKPSGKIYGYEIREDFIKIASKNLDRTGLSEYVEIKNKDASNGFDEINIDTIILDLGNPWELIPKIKTSLKGSGILTSFSPTIDQVDKTVHALKVNNFGDIHTIECLIREWQVEKNKVRPDLRMIGHTGFLTFARKINE
ncbi:MAG: tRNA (adenine-N1)-methyltransferase [Candidatus Lokiarchaeota archaeon]|nr:tRNA (adenine-N1)-methyltransferase [Candidatus Lokiarchaeota archaeon]